MKQGSFTLFCLILSCIIGVGIFTGQEVLTYFGTASIVGFLSAFLSCVVFFFLLKFCLSLAGNQTYTNLCEKKWFKFCTNVIYIIVAGGMLSALRVISNNLFVPLSACILGAIFAGKLEKAFDKLNIIFCFVMLIFVFILTGKNVNPAKIPFLSPIKLPFLKSIFFVSFNLFLCAPFLAKRGEELSKKQKNLISSLSAVILFILIILSMLVLSNCGKLLPFLNLASNKTGYTAILCISAITTLFGIFASSKRISQSSITFIIVVVFSAFLSLMPFDKIVDYFYVASGIFALCFFLFLLANKRKML